MSFLIKYYLGYEHKSNSRAETFVDGMDPVNLCTGLPQLITNEATEIFIPFKYFNNSMDHIL